MHLWIERVPTSENIADLPSREEYGLMEAIGAQWVPPMLATVYAKIGEYCCVMLFWSSGLVLYVQV